jgi:putative membrane protein
MSFIFKLLLHILISAGVLWIIDIYLFGDLFSITGEGLERYLVVAFMFGLLNIFVKPILKLLLLPVKILTLGLAGLAVNGILLAIIAFILTTFEVGAATIVVQSWVTYLFVGVVISVANTLVHWID